MITARHSQRAPFGTGPAVKKILQRQAEQLSYTYYNPAVFTELKQVLSHFHLLYEYKDKPAQWLALQTEASNKALAALDIHRLFDHLNKQAYQQTQCLQQAHQWFDAFRTLKFIHHLENAFPKMPLEKAIAIFYNY